MQRVPSELFDRPPADHPNQVVAYVSDIRRGGGLSPHSHPRAQLLAIVSGSIAVTTVEGTFIVPSERALWIPADVVHETRHLSSTRVHTIYVGRDRAAGLPRQTTVVHVGPLMRALLDAVMVRRRSEPDAGAAGRLTQVLLDQISSSAALPLRLPMPRSPALRRIADALLDNPDDRRTVGEWGAKAVISVRTLERKFKDETGLSLRSFRRQAKLFKAIELLSQGRSVSEISDVLGFEGPSAFIAMFKMAFGVTPGRYLKTYSPY